MATYQQNLIPAQQQPGGTASGPPNPMVSAAQASAQDAMAFQLWVAQQSQTLGRLKIFHSMAKSINDQQ
ncbi:hypothetical protein [Duganella radicis]|uniref:Uncharacterized protein n=1 Tax=Duganella radicis TaxID=551988 RepID=A0A6L6PPM4_9BURK|nr:hypothetical protein [Duganella radicis]MTV41068.1 hypothetical protein [Duganella radicis]